MISGSPCWRAASTGRDRHHQGAAPQKATGDIQRERAISQAGFDFGRYTDWEFDNNKPAIRADIERMLGI